jgi:hypothetical protein
MKEKIKEGRPTKYNKEIVAAAREYIQNYKAYDDVIPSHAGMACVLKLNKSTLYDWANDPEKDFSDILAECNQAQERVLLNGGLDNSFNSAITKLALGKQGYSEKTEVDNTHVLMSHEEWLDSLDG